MKSPSLSCFFGNLGNGTTVCNKAVEENGDYKKIAHISKGGNITLYVDKAYIPVTEMKKIESMAIRDKKQFQACFERLPLIEQYRKIIDWAPLKTLVDFLNDKRTLEEKVPEMREYYYTLI